LGEGLVANSDHKRETIKALAVDANHNIYARGRSPSPSPYFFGNTSPATTVNGFQTVCESCTGDPGTTKDDVVAFVVENWEPTLTISPTSLTFAGQIVGTTSASKSVTVTNTGLAPVSLLPIVASGDFAFHSNSCP